MFTQQGTSIVVIIVFLAMLLSTTNAGTSVHLRLAPSPRVVDKGVQFDVGLYASTDDGVEQTISAMDVILSWNSKSMQLLGVYNNGSYVWLQSGLLADPLNDSLEDGNAKYTALSSFGAPAIANTDGFLVTTLQFVALAEFDLSHIVIVPQLNIYAMTRVYGADFVGQNVTGSFSNADISIVATSDCDQDGDFDLHELQHFQECFTGELLPDVSASYPMAPEFCCVIFDHDDDGDIDLKDFSFFLELLTTTGT